MATLDWSQCSAVESIPGKVSGAWVFKDTRMPVAFVFENLEAGATIDEIMDWFHLTREQITSVLEFAARSLDPPPPGPYASTSTENPRPIRPEPSRASARRLEGPQRHRGRGGRMGAAGQGRSASSS